MEQLRWLPDQKDWRQRLRGLASGTGDPWPEAVALANARIDFTRTNALDDILRRRLADLPATAEAPVRLAVLGSSTLAHLLPGMRVGGLRRGMRFDTWEGEYGQYLPDLLDPSSPLHLFRPNVVLFAFDAAHLSQGVHAALGEDDVRIRMDEVADRLRQCWSLARAAFGGQIIQQTGLDVFPALLGSNEYRLPGSRSRFIAGLNDIIRRDAEAFGVDLLALDDAARQDGVSAWHSPDLWHRAKQEVTPALSPSYGDLLARLVAAKRGRSRKCLVLDLDNTLWGGVIGDDGLDGIVLGQGSALGEGFAAVQAYAKELARRGVILAVSSKNDPQNAWEVFDKHPEMLLRRQDIASFRVNWDDKVANIRAAAEELNIGLESLVFLDDNPFERSIVREHLPMVAVPEVPDDNPSLVPGLLADAGYFESLTLTNEDRQRSAQYQENRARTELQTQATDIDAYLRSLDMRLVWKKFDRLNLQRVVQLMNKTNQFNLTTRRHTEAFVEEVIADPKSFGLLLDRFGDNGIIAVVIGRMRDRETVTIDTWLMSCRVLGRQVEVATLNVVAAQARALGAVRLAGEYIPTPKNAMVAEHYAKLGFEIAASAEDGSSLATLDLACFEPRQSFITILEG
jgi:FkbH-like protein